MKRERQFEVMRTVAMFFIVVYHCLTHGVGDDTVFSTHNPVSMTNILFSDFLLVFSSISVNLYVMVSGYFLADLDFKMSRIVRTWVQACFYSCVITILMMSLGLIPFNIVSIGKSFFPLSTDAYWFVTQFIGLMILSPFLVLLVRQLSYKQFVWLLIGGAFICLAIIPDFPLGKRFHVAHGNSVWSFAYLFMIAGFIRHHLQEISKEKLFVAIILITILTMACEFFFGYHYGYVSLYWFNYNGLPFILSILVFVLVRQIYVPDSVFWNVLVKLAPYSFGVYLIHDQLLVRDWLWSNKPITSFCDQWIYPLVVLGLCILIFLSCAFVDSIRKKMFAWLGIDKLILKVDQWPFYS